MKSVVSVSVVGCFLLLNACATQRSDTATLVQVTVTGNTDVSDSFARDVRGAALTAISRYVPHARPLTVAVVLEGATAGASGTLVGTQPQSRIIPSLSRTPEDDGMRASVPVRPLSIAGESPMSTAELRGSYTITDGDGRLLDSNRLRVDAANRDGVAFVREALIRQTGDFIASRVQAVSR